MEHDPYIVKRLSTIRTCRFCNITSVIELKEAVTAPLEQLSSEIGSAIEAELEELGWVSGACPLCAFARSEQLAAEARADDERDMWSEEVAAS